MYLQPTEIYATKQTTDHGLFEIAHGDKQMLRSCSTCLEAIKVEEPGHDDLHIAWFRFWLDSDLKCRRHVFTCFLIRFLFTIQRFQSSQKNTKSDGHSKNHAIGQAPS